MNTDGHSVPWPQVKREAPVAPAVSCRAESRHRVPRPQNTEPVASPADRGCRLASALLAALTVVFLAARAPAEDFNWSWEAPVEETAPAPVAREPAATNAPAAGFDWSFDDARKAGDVPAAPEVTRPAAPAPKEQSPGIAAAAYEQLLRENLELRKKVEQAVSEKESAESANRRLQKEMAELDSKITESAATIRNLQSAQAAAAGDEGKLSELKAQAAAAESQKEQMGREMAALRARLVELQAAEVPPPPDSGVKPGSDLFRKLEEDNAAMRTRLAEIEKQRAEERKAREQAEVAAVWASEKAQAVETQLAGARQQIEDAAVREKQDKEKVEDVLSRIPELEQKLSRAETVKGRHESIAEQRDAEMASMREELARREYRLRKAEKMAAMLQEARREVHEVSNREKRDMHYNMAAVYARDGRYREAEREYLQALEIDPADAACHFNLGILYDDRLDDKRRAAIHYRRYVKLAPHAPDVDQVKVWLMKIEME